MNYTKVSEAPTFSYYQNLVDGITDNQAYERELEKIMNREAQNRYEAKDKDGNTCLIQNPALMNYQASKIGMGGWITRYKPVVIAQAERSTGRKITNF